MYMYMSMYIYIFIYMYIYIYIHTKYTPYQGPYITLDRTSAGLEVLADHTLEDATHSDAAQIFAARA